MKLLSIIVIFLLTNITFSQDSISNSKKLDSILKTDFLSYNYKYLDKTFKINIKQDVYNKSLTEHKFILNKTFNYSDSLNVVLMAEFNDWDATRIANLRITYSWDRVGYYLWKEKDEIIEIAKKNNIHHPYRLQELIKNNNEKVSIEIDELRKKLFLQFGNIDLKTMTVDQLLAFSFKNNPKVVKLKQESIKKSNIRKFVAKHNRQPTALEEKNLGEGCGKEDCCQKPSN
ncbi:hypothetical protein DMB65_03075 [Flavobacterium cheongpyeongense]|uniref:Uncharacterized protein n=1 Tax=Flavobacterium cheongpyeongense TaxID=2212651 RepID=A0A2V4BT25_9FLAO|nr:hypothetical protein [Flavobacterium cheongpyeongense]PXY42229.1 hypothetical protein DMB65_03075 [Flavobacterium cheongpyeongense]